MKKIFKVQALKTAVLLFAMLGMSACFSFNPPSSGGGSSSSSGYAPSPSSLVGKWFDLSPALMFSYNGSSWDIAKGTTLKALEAGGVRITDFSVTGGHINYTKTDSNTATMEWSVSYSYTTAKTSYSSGGTYNDTETGNVTLHFTSYQGGYASGYINGSYSDYRSFSLQ